MISGPILDVRAKPDQLTFEYGQEAAGPLPSFEASIQVGPVFSIPTVPAQT
jgi:hypothetical protein